MFVVEEVRGNLNMYHLFSRLHLIPIVVDRVRGQIKITPASDHKSWLLWKMNFALVLCHWLYMIFRLAQVFYAPHIYLKLNHLPLHLGFSLFYGAAIFWIFTLYFRHPDITVAIFNCLLAGHDDVDSRNKIAVQQNKSKKSKTNNQNSENNENNNGPSSPPAPPPRKLWNLRKFSKQELYVMCLPYSVYSGLIFYMGLHCYDPTYNHFICSSILEYVDSGSRYHWFVPLFALVEGYMITFWAASGSFLGFLFLVFFQKIMSRIDIGVRHLGSTKNSWLLHHRISACYQDVREIQLLIQAYNGGFAYVIFISKILSMTISIILWTFSIRLIQMQSEPLMAGFYGLVASQFEMGFVVCFERAFAIPKAVSKYKKAIAKAASQNSTKITSIAQVAGQVQPKPNKPRRYDYERATNSIPNKCGIRVGHFNYMERAVTLGFINFVSKNVFKLLITLRK